MSNTSLAYDVIQNNISQQDHDQTIDSKINESEQVISFTEEPRANDFSAVSLRTRELDIDTETIKTANRAIRAKTPESERKALIEERNNLVQKKYTSSLTKKEQTRLQMLRWQIEGIEDTIIGQQLDFLEKLAERQESLGNIINNFKDDIQKIDISKGGKRG